MTEQDYQKLADEFKKLKNDEDRWGWVISNQDLGITVNLDNDDTFVTFDADVAEEVEILCFDGYIGNGPGVPELLEAVGIKCELV